MQEITPLFETAIKEAISQQKGTHAEEEKEPEATHYYTIAQRAVPSGRECVDFYPYILGTIWHMNYFDVYKGSRKSVPLNPAQTKRLLNSRIPLILEGLSEKTPLPVPAISNIVLGYLEEEVRDVEFGKGEIQFTNPFNIVTDPAQQAVLADIFSDISKAQKEIATREAVYKFEQLQVEVEKAAIDMGKNPLYTASSHKLRVVRILDTALEKMVRELENALKDKGTETFLEAYKVQLDRAAAVASIIVMYDTKGSRMAQLHTSFFGKSGEATEITLFWRWLTRAEHELLTDFHAVLDDLRAMLSGSIKEIGVLDTQKPFKSLLEKIDQPGVDGVAMLRSFITTGSLVPAQEAAVRPEEEGLPPVRASR